MEKKGDLLTQLALISDLFERANMESEDTSVVFIITSDESNRLFNLISKKANTKLIKTDDTFSVKIGVVEYVFTTNKNNV